MTNDLQLIVHFSCPHCTTVYTASQEEQPQQCSVTFIAAVAPVHEWTGLYDFFIAFDHYSQKWPPPQTTMRGLHYGSFQNLILKGDSKPGRRLPQPPRL
jgi:hypothetical protein